MLTCPKWVFLAKKVLYKVLDPYFALQWIKKAEIWWADNYMLQYCRVKFGGGSYLTLKHAEKLKNRGFSTLAVNRSKTNRQWLTAMRNIATRHHMLLQRNRTSWQHILLLRNISIQSNFSPATYVAREKCKILFFFYL